MQSPLRFRPHACSRIIEVVLRFRIFPCGPSCYALLRLCYGFVTARLEKIPSKMRLVTMLRLPTPKPSLSLPSRVSPPKVGRNLNRNLSRNLNRLPGVAPIPRRHASRLSSPSSAPIRGIPRLSAPIRGIKTSFCLTPCQNQTPRRKNSAPGHSISCTECR